MEEIMAYFISPLSKADIDAVNNWHWPLTYEGNVDIFAPIVCDTPEKIEYRHKRLLDRFKHAFNTYKKYRYDSQWIERTTWLLQVIAKTFSIDSSVIPEPLHRIVPAATRLLESTDEEEIKELRTKCFNIIDIYIAGLKPETRGRKPSLKEMADSVKEALESL
jgi:hypothetical protein